MFAYSYVDDVVDYPPAQGGHQLYSTVEKKRVPSHDDDSTSGYPDIISTTQVGWQFVGSLKYLVDLLNPYLEKSSSKNIEKMM